MTEESHNRVTLFKISCQRAHFAAMAMQGLLTGDTCQKIGAFGCEYGNRNHELVAKESLRYADALIEELNK